MAEPNGAPNSTVNPAAMPVMVRVLVSTVETFHRPASQEPRPPVVWTSGASGPMPPPEEMHNSETGISERRSWMSSAPPSTWMLLTSSSTSPGVPRIRVRRPTAMPTATRMPRWAVVDQWVGQRARCISFSTPT